MTAANYDVFGLMGKRALVTGAAQGFGACIARRLVEAGVHVIVADRNAGLAGRLAAELGGCQSTGADESTVGSAQGAHVDVSDETSVGALFESHPGIDILVNNAGVFSNFMAVDLPADEFDRIMAVNVRGAFLCAREFARRALAEPGPGRTILSIASVDALSPSCEGQVHYTASKHAIAGLTKALSVELAPRGIRVNAVCPGASMTEGALAFVAAGSPQGVDLATQWDGIAARTPMGRLVESADVADAVLFLVSDLARSVTGVLLPVDGGILAQPLEGYTGG